MDNNLNATIDDSDYSNYSDYEVNLQNRLLQATEMILRLEDITLTSVFVGELLELPHIESNDERLNWLEDIYQDLSSNTHEQSKTELSISKVDKLLLEELLGYFCVTLEELEKATVVPEKQPSSGNSMTQKNQTQELLDDATPFMQDSNKNMQPKPKAQKELISYSV